MSKIKDSVSTEDLVRAVEDQLLNKNPGSFAVVESSSGETRVYYGESTQTETQEYLASQIQSKEQFGGSATMYATVINISIIASAAIALFARLNYNAFEPEKEPINYKIAAFKKVTKRGMALHLALYILLFTVFIADEELAATLEMLLLTVLAYILIFLFVPRKIKNNHQKNENENLKAFMAIRSAQKTKLMEKVVNELQDPYSNELEDAIFALYLFIEADFLLGPVIEKYGAGYETIRNIIINLNSYTNWENQWHKYQFIPVCSVSFEETLEKALYLHKGKVPLALMWNEMRKSM